MTHHTGSDEGRVALVAWFHAELGGECIARHRDTSVVPPCENWADQFLRTGPGAAAPDALRERVEALAAEWSHSNPGHGDFLTAGRDLRAALADPTDGATT